MYIRFVTPFFNIRVFQHKDVAEPTAAGKAVLDAFHPYGQVARLRKKPLWAFEGGDQYLHLHLAEKEGLITTVVEVGLCIHDFDILVLSGIAYSVIKRHQ